MFFSKHLKAFFCPLKENSGKIPTKHNWSNKKVQFHQLTKAHKPPTPQLASCNFFIIIKKQFYWFFHKHKIIKWNFPTSKKKFFCLMLPGTASYTFFLLYNNLFILNMNFINIIQFKNKFVYNLDDGKKWIAVT